MLGHARRGARAAAEVRRRARRAPGASSRRSPAALDAALADGTGPLYALPTYTALLELRDLLAERAARWRALAMSFSPLVVWHDVECGRYDADLPLWRELAASARRPVLDVGAGTGRVALDLARAGSP